MCMEAESYTSVERSSYTSVTVLQTVGVVRQGFVVTYVVIEDVPLNYIIIIIIIIVVVT